MKSASGQLITLLNSGLPVYMADLLTITTALGTVYYWTDTDADLVLGGVTYQNPTNSGVYWERGATKSRLGLEVDTLEIDLHAPTTLLIGGIPFMQALSNGYLDGAKVNLQIAVMSSFGDTTPGAVWGFDGVITQVDASRYTAKLQVSSMLYLMDVQYPTHICQSGCMNSLGDSACGVNLAGSYTFARTDFGGSTQSLINVTDAAASGYYDLGKITFTSGQNTGATRTIRKFTAGSPATIALIQPLPYAPSAGDAFNLVPGCNKLYADANGCLKFANQGRYRGAPEVPVPETAR